MKKILFTATITDHFYYFHLPYFKMFKEQGWEVHVASHGDRVLPNCDVQHEIPIARSPFSKSNIKAYKMLKEIIKKNDYDVIHCHTPMGGMLTRLAAASVKSKAKVIYTAHGFHFYKGAPLLNWMIYYPIEKFMSYKTDCLITINKEDYNFSEKHFSHPDLKLVDGVGYNCDKFFYTENEEKQKIREEKGFSSDEKLIIYVAEMNKNKNQSMLIEALKYIPKARLIIVGADNYNGEYKKFAKDLGVDEKVDFFGHREDVDQLLKMSDICAASSLREGLPVNIMEAMACGLPVVAADNRGHRALINSGVDGYLVEQNNSKEMAEKINALLDNPQLYQSMSKCAAENIKRFSKESVLLQMEKIYSEIQR